MPANLALHDPDEVLSPGLLFYPERIERNLRLAIQMAGGAERLRPHVKTHKTAEIVRMMLAAGVTRHKAATIAEAEVLGQLGAPDVLVAYQMVGPNVGRLVTLVERFPGTAFSCLVDDLETGRMLGAEAAARGVAVSVYVDLDVGMHRSGIEPAAGAVLLYQELSRIPGLRPVGLSAYDGHNVTSSAEERQRVADGFMERVMGVRAAIEGEGLAVPRLVVGGTPSFPMHARREVPGLELSPGTFILQDCNYGPARYSDLADFQPAAVLLTRVISRPVGGRVTFDLGHKAVAADPGAVASRLCLLNMPGAMPVAQSEEHLVVETEDADRFRPGDVAYALPGHVCPTVALHEFAYVVREGRVVDQWRIIARRRVLSV